MQKIYCVWGSSGSYDDYSEYIVKAFFDKDAAEKFKDDYNEDLIENKKQYYICDECMSRFYDTVVTKQESQQKFINLRNCECKHAKIVFDEDGNIRCENEITWYDSHDKHESNVKPLIVN
jgi:hypothetical protein